MIIRLSNEYYIEKDELNYILVNTYMSYGNGKHKSELPRQVTKTIGYFSRLEYALEKYAERALSEGLEDADINASELADRVKEIMDSAVDRMKNLTKGRET